MTYMPASSHASTKAARAISAGTSPSSASRQARRAASCASPPSTGHLSSRNRAASAVVATMRYCPIPVSNFTGLLHDFGSIGADLRVTNHDGYSLFPAPSQPTLEGEWIQNHVADMAKSKSSGSTMTVGQLQRQWRWVWLYCEYCPRYRAATLAQFSILLGMDTPADVLRRRIRCDWCGKRGVRTLGPSWAGSAHGFEEFPPEGKRDGPVYRSPI